MQPPNSVASPQTVQTSLCSHPIPFNEFVYVIFNKIFEIAIILNAPLGDNQDPYRLSRKCSDESDFTQHVRNLVPQLKSKFTAYDLGETLFVPNPRYLVSAWRIQDSTRAVFEAAAGMVYVDFPEVVKSYKLFYNILIDKSERFFDLAMLTPGLDYAIGAKFVDMVAIDFQSKQVTFCSPHLPNNLTLCDLENFDHKTAYLLTGCLLTLFTFNAPGDPYIGLNIARIENVIFGPDCTLKIQFQGNRVVLVDLGSLSPVDAFCKINAALKSYKNSLAETSDKPTIGEEITTSLIKADDNSQTNQTTPLMPIHTQPESIHCAVANIDFALQDLIYISLERDRKTIHLCKNIILPCAGNRLNLIFPTQAEFEAEAQNLTHQVDKLKSKLARFSFEKVDLALNPFFLVSLWQTDKLVKFHFLGKDQQRATFADSFEVATPKANCFPLFAERMEEKSPYTSLFFQDKNSRCQLSIESIDLLITYKQKYTWEIISPHTPASPYQPYAAKETFKKKTRQLIEMVKDQLFLVTDNASISVSIRLKKMQVARLQNEQSILVRFVSKLEYVLTQEHFGEQSLVDGFNKLQAQLQ